MAQTLLSPGGRPSSRRGVGNLGSPPFVFEEEYQKPRLEHYRALMSKASPDLEFIKSSFEEWSQYPEWVVFQGEHIHTGENRFKAVKSAKRGNDVYSWRINKRLEELEALPDTKFFNYRDRSSRHKTRALFVTLTFARIQRLDLAWENVGKAWNRYMSRLRRRFGSVYGFRVWEAQRDGYPHVHAVLVFESSEFEAFFYNGVWRVQGKREILEPLWEYGFSDYEALTGIREGARYVTKYLTKLHRVLEASGTSPEAGASRELNNLHFNSSVLTLSLMWIFRRRAFGFSRHLLDLIRRRTNSNNPEVAGFGQLDLEGSPVWVWRIVGFWGGVLGDKWSRELSLREFRGLKSDSSWSDSINNR